MTVTAAGNIYGSTVMNFVPTFSASANRTLTLCASVQSNPAQAVSPVLGAKVCLVCPCHVDYALISQE
jgi:hypothetical protein